MPRATLRRSSRARRGGRPRRRTGRELRASAIAVRKPPYEPPQMPMRDASTSGCARSQRAPATTSLILATRPARPRPRRAAGTRAVADAEPVVHREHDEAAAREVLVHRVRVRVVVAVVPAEQHLPRRAAVHEDHGGPLLAGRRAGGRRAGRASSMPSAARERHLRRRHEPRGREVGGHAVVAEHARGARAFRDGITAGSGGRCAVAPT